MLKVFKEIIRFFVILIIISAVTLGTGFYFLSDNNNKAKNYTTIETDTYESFNELVIKGSENINDTSNPKFSILINEEEFNSIIYVIKEQINTSLENYNFKIENFEIYFNHDGEIEIYTYFTYGILHGSLTGVIDIYEDNDLITIKMSSLKLSKINLPLTLFKSIMTAFISEDDVRQSLSIEGIDTEFDASSLSMSVRKSQLITLITNTMNNDLFTLGSHLIINDDNIDYVLVEDGNFGVSLLLKNLLYTSDYYSLYKNYDEYEKEAKEKLAVLNSNNQIDYQSTGAAYAYLLSGYDRFSQIYSSDIIDNIDFSSVNINDITTYQGIIPYNNEYDIGEIIDKEMVSIDLNKLIFSQVLSVKLNESIFNDALINSPVPACSYAFIYNGKIATFSFEQFYFNLEENNLNLTGIINFDGQKVAFDVNADHVDKNSNLIFNLQINRMRIGSTTVNDEDMISILKYLSKLKLGDYLSIDAKNLILSFDFNVLLSQYIDDLTSILNFDISLEKDNFVIDVSLA